uniref:Uncharacterized protein n=1 Tax=Panagrolaimus sp. PS1159 TaxID=55785 RepID=A0AC35FI62_9BILA
MYFLCDSYCCADECCEKDWPLTIIGGICIFFFALIPAYCLLSCFVSYIRNSRNKYPTFKNNNNSIEYKGVT